MGYYLVNIDSSMKDQVFSRESVSAVSCKTEISIENLGIDFLAGGLCVLIFCLEWVVLTLAFFLKYYAYVEGGDLSKRSAKVQQVEEEDMKNWPWPFQV